MNHSEGLLPKTVYRSRLRQEMQLVTGDGGPFLEIVRHIGWMYQSGITWVSDHWSRHFLEGVWQASLRSDWSPQGKNVIEVGTGAALIGFGLLYHGASSLLATDINSQALAIAQENEQRMRAIIESAQKKERSQAKDYIQYLADMTLGGIEYSPGSLLSNIAAEKKGTFDQLWACIPQAIAPAETDLADGQGQGNYYSFSLTDIINHNGFADNVDDQKFINSWNTHSLGLNAALLLQAKEFLKPGGRVFLNLGGRPGWEKLCQMIIEAGFVDPEAVHTNIVLQDPGTDIKPFVGLEQKTGDYFEFFADPAGLEPINAQQAQVLRERGELVYHKIYVITARRAV